MEVKYSLFNLFFQMVLILGYVCGRGYQDILQRQKSPDPLGGHRTTPRFFFLQKS
jgi:hypothetical protein